MTDHLRALWDFDDLDATEERLRAALAEAPGPERAEVLTQLARVEGLRDRFEEGEELLVEAEKLAGSELARARILLERGRLLRSSGNPDAALPLFEDAVDVALSAQEYFIAADAAHMAALATSAREVQAAWTEKGIEIAGRSEDAAYWLGPLLNNLGWFRYEAGEYQPALEAFEGALEARLRDPRKPYAVAVARYAVAKSLRALGRPEEAVAQMEQAIAWARESRTEDGWFHEELAEDYAALDRATEAAEQARLALPLLRAQDPALDVGREERLAQLSAES